ncbi:Cytochrome P450 84A1 like [Actinidia chinensis var. chinensis]|uniref:Cytochrome P450 84A1 like n=1 Tax=Actinidia chinensis var. chinensis TaxID=1590841 RepID=A0A2R6R6Q3_ACTCC|nr:Cytochrome P450 84A1 like [Actinidia chinensis var. chinensis]
MDHLLSTICILFAFSLFFFFFRSKPKLPYPPGPKGLPVIGNMLMMGQLTHRGLARLGKQYGGLVHLKMGGLHMVVVSTPEMAREVLQVQDKVFANRPGTVAIRYLTYNRADMAFAHYGPFWRQMRKICIMKVFSRKRAESWASVREEIDSLIAKISTQVGSPVNIGELVFALTSNITYRAAFGSISQEGQDEFVKILQEFSKLFGAFNIGDFFPSLGWVHGDGFNNRLEKARGSLDGFIDRVIDDHVAKEETRNKDCEDDADMVDELLAFCDEDAGKGNGDGLRITRDNIKALIMDVMFGGTETVASAIEWTMAELLRNRESLKNLQQELADVVGLDRNLHESDLENLPYFKCVVKETLRLHPPIPLLLHESASETSVAGHLIPAKSRVMINAWAIGRDGGSWADPNAFKPSRFLTCGSRAPDFKGTDFEFIPFGSGRRSCPGMQLGLYAMELAVAHLCHCFTWELPDGMTPSELDMSDVFGLTAPRATRLIAVPSCRLLGSLG